MPQEVEGRNEGARLLGPAERSERRYLRNYDDLGAGHARGGGGAGDGSSKSLRCSVLIFDAAQRTSQCTCLSSPKYTSWRTPVPLVGTFRALFQVQEEVRPAAAVRTKSQISMK